MKRMACILLALSLGCLILPAALAEPDIIVPDAYTQTGTLPIYRATARDFSKEEVNPELFNQSGVVSRNEYMITFADEAILDVGIEALFYDEYSGTFDANAVYDDGGEPDHVPRPALSNSIASLASSAALVRPQEEQIDTLEKTELSMITLEEAQKKLEILLEQLGIMGYVCDDALDMSVERIIALGAMKNEQIASGELFTNIPQADYSMVTEEDEGYFLSYHKPGDQHGQGNGDIFSVYAYVTTRGVVDLAIRDQYIQGEVYSTPKALIDPKIVINKLPEEVAASRYPENVMSISKVQLTYTPKRAPKKADGMVLSPIWLVTYQDEQAHTQGYDCWAEFDAVDGKLLNAIFK